MRRQEPGQSTKWGVIRKALSTSIAALSLSKRRSQPGVRPPAVADLIRAGDRCRIMLQVIFYFD
jgi:hypothetical protein